MEKSCVHNILWRPLPQKVRQSSMLSSIQFVCGLALWWRVDVLDSSTRTNVAGPFSLALSEQEVAEGGAHNRSTT